MKKSNEKKTIINKQPKSEAPPQSNKIAKKGSVLYLSNWELTTITAHKAAFNLNNWRVTLKLKLYHLL